MFAPQKSFTNPGFKSDNSRFSPSTTKQCINNLLQNYFLKSAVIENLTKIHKEKSFEILMDFKKSLYQD